MTTLRGRARRDLRAIIGSFLNVVAYRLPRGESLAHPPSRCPECGTPIKPYDNVPVLGWLLLRGRCRHCGAPISARYPLVEAVTALLCAPGGRLRAPTSDAGSASSFVLLLVPITLIDLDHHIIPNKLTLSGRRSSALALVAVFETDSLVEHLIAAAAAGGFLLLAAIVYPGGMGMGDVKLAAVLGLFLGRAVAPAIFAALHRRHARRRPRSSRA